jgi:hypothetical protein
MPPVSEKLSCSTSDLGSFPPPSALTRIFGGDMAKERLTYPSIPDISRRTQYSGVRSEGQLRCAKP